MKETTSASPTYANNSNNNSVNITTHPAYRNFVNSLHAPFTKRNYTYSLSKYYLSSPENKGLTLDQILEKDVKSIEYEIIETMNYMRETLELSFSTIHTFTSAVIHFFEINDVALNKRKINKFRGENVAKFEYRGYSTTEIASLLSVCDERGKAAVLMMASTGMRVGALPEIKLKHLKRWQIDSQDTYVYQITVYTNSPKYKYVTFCSPECAKAIDSYLELRKRCGENLNKDTISGNWLPTETYLLIRSFDKEQYPIIPKKILSDSITKYIVFKLEESGQRTRQRIVGDNQRTKNSEAAKFKNALHPCHSLRIFSVTNMQRSKVDKTIIEMMIGHRTGLDSAYYKPQDQEILQEYLKAIDNLTINNENRLKQQIQKVTNERDEIKTMEEKHKEELKKMKDEMENKFSVLLNKIDLVRLN